MYIYIFVPSRTLGYGILNVEMCLSPLRFQGMAYAGDSCPHAVVWYGVMSEISGMLEILVFQGSECGIEG